MANAARTRSLAKGDYRSRFGSQRIAESQLARRLASQRFAWSTPCFLFVQGSPLLDESSHKLQSKQTPFKRSIVPCLDKRKVDRCVTNCLTTAMFRTARLVCLLLVVLYFPLFSDETRTKRSKKGNEEK